LEHQNRVEGALDQVRKLEQRLASFETSQSSTNDEDRSAIAGIRSSLDRVAGLDEKVAGIDEIVLTTTRHSIPYGMTGHDVCAAHGDICLFVLPSKSYDKKNRFAGYVTPSCASKVYSDDVLDCWEDHKLICVIDKAPFRRAIDADPHANVDPSTLMCVGNEGDRDPKHCQWDYAICASTEGV